jgi:predicted DNA-binding transcriptional regulator YafY
MEEDDVQDIPANHEYLLPEQHHLSAHGPKQDSTERIFRLLQFLLANECTRQDVFERLAFYYKIDPEALNENGVSRKADKMFERDITFLRNQGFELKTVKNKGQLARYSVVKGSGPRPTFIFTQNDVDILALLHNMFADPTRYAPHDLSQPLPLQSSRNPFAEEMLALIEKLVATLPDEQQKTFDRWVRKPYIYFNLATVSDYLPHRPSIDVIVRAIAQRQQIAFVYMPTHRKQETILHEHIDPYYVTYLEGHFYLLAYSHKRDQFFEYRLDRIQPETLKVQPDMIDVERRRRPIEFTFWIDANLAKRGLSQRWLTQTLEREEVSLDEHGRERRRILVRATAYNSWRVTQQILKYGDKAELVDPPYLRETMKKTVARMYKFYE